MKVTDYIVQFLQSKGIRDAFGYQGTMIAHLADSLSRCSKINNHSGYHEQGAAFAACGYAQASGECAFCYATSGPGAANLLSGIANAYFDSLPVIFVTGQLNTYEYSGIEGLRQQGFQEINIVAMASPVTKYAVKVEEASQIVEIMEKAYSTAVSGRRGPVLIDIPMNIQRGEVFPDTPEEGTRTAAAGHESRNEDPGPAMSTLTGNEDLAFQTILDSLKQARRPVILAGAGVSREGWKNLRFIAQQLAVPVITSVPACDRMAWDDPLYFGCLGGAYGHRYANMIAGAKSDLLLAFGISLCTRQVGTKTWEFAKEARLIRVDLDAANLSRSIHKTARDREKDSFFKVQGAEGIESSSPQNESGYKASLWEKELCCHADANAVLARWAKETGRQSDKGLPMTQKPYAGWLEKASVIRRELRLVDEADPGRLPNRIVAWLGEKLSSVRAVGVDVGQHMVWTYQSFPHRQGQRLLFSGGHGAMGYGLPAAIGAFTALEEPAACITGDGAFQMNIQELQWIVREKIPIHIIVMNNQSLGMIRQLQKDYFDECYEGTSPEGGFSSPDFSKIARAYGLKAARVSAGELEEWIRTEGREESSPDKAALSEPESVREAETLLGQPGPALLEICFEPGTFAYPKTCLGEPVYNQQPYAPEDVYKRLMAL